MSYGYGACQMLQMNRRGLCHVIRLWGMPDAADDTRLTTLRAEHTPDKAGSLGVWCVRRAIKDMRHIPRSI